MNFLLHVACKTCKTCKRIMLLVAVDTGLLIYKIALWLGDDVRVIQKHYTKLVPNDAK